METERASSNGSSKRKTISKPNGPQFTIPRLKKIKRDLLTELSLDSHECQNDILAPVKKSFHFHASYSSHEFLRVQSVHNPGQVTKYLERRKDMKSNGYSDALVSDTVAFIPVESNSQIELLCRNGVKCGNQKLSGLGVPHMGVHVCKHADIISPMKPKPGERVLIAVKVIKGRVKTVLCRGVGCELEPTPNYDCHIPKSNLDQPAAQSPHLLFYSSQLYVYEYGDFDVEEYPRQVLPFAVIYYSIKEMQQIIPKAINSSSPHLAQTALPSSTLNSGPAVTWPGQGTGALGPANEVWRGRLYVRLIDGGHIYIDVSMLSYYVPLTVNIISPIKIHGLFPEHNAQFTFLNGLSNLAEHAEVEWRANYFRSYLMRPHSNNAGHFKALVKHISAKREMPTVRLPNDVFLFLMPNCLLASQLGLVRREDNTPVLHCVLMSKFSTSEAEKKKLAAKRRPVPNFGTATSWEELFDDSDFSDDEAPESNLEPERQTHARLAQILPLMFKDQCSIQNKFAGMSLADAEANLSQCSCRSFSESKVYKQRCRDAAVQRILAALQSVNQPSQKPAVASHFPTGSRLKPTVKVTHRTRNMPSFSPHGSSESESDSENSHRSSRKSKSHLSILHSTKTVEEELSEEELTNEQMEDIIFMRKKPTQTASAIGLARIKQEAASSPKLNRQSQLKDPTIAIPKPNPQASPLSPVALLPSQQFDTEFNKRAHTEPSFSSTPKIIPMEPVEEPYSPPTNSPDSPGVSNSPSGVSPPESRNFTPDTVFRDKKASSTSSEAAPKLSKTLQELKKGSSQLQEKDSPSVKCVPKVQNDAMEASKNIPLSPTKSTKHHKLISTMKARRTGDLPISSAVSENKTSPRQTSLATSAAKFSSAQSPKRGGIGRKKSPSPSPPPSSPSSLQSEAQMKFQEEMDFGDVDMRVPSHRSSSLNPVFLTAQEQGDIQSQKKNPPSPSNLSFGMWLAPGDIVAPLKPPPFPAGLLSESAEVSPLQGPKSPSPPCSPVSLPANSPPSPTDSPASPPIESPASPPSPSSPAEPDLESPMSPPRSSTFSTLRSTPIAIPTSRLEQQTSSPEVNYFQRHSLFASRSFGDQAFPTASGSGIDNADDMKDFLNGGFNSDLDSSYEDER